MPVGASIDRRAVVGRRPRVAVVVGVGADRGADRVAHPEDRGVGEQVVLAETPRCRPSSHQLSQRSRIQASMPAGESAARRRACSGRARARRGGRRTGVPARRSGRGRRRAGRRGIGLPPLRSQPRSPLKSVSFSPEPMWIAVQLVGVLVAELAGDQRADVAAAGGVLLVAEHVRSSGCARGRRSSRSSCPGGSAAAWRTRTRAATARSRRTRRPGSPPYDAGSASGSITFDQCQNVHGQPWVRISGDRVRADAGLAHEVHGYAVDVDAVVLVGVDRRAPPRASRTRRPSSRRARCR